MRPGRRVPRAIARKVAQSRGRIMIGESAAAVIASYPKSGRTWLRFMLANYFAMRRTEDAVDTESMFAYLPNYDLDPVRGIPAYVRREESMNVPLIPSTHSQFDAGHVRGVPLIFMVRDPRDLMVSAYFHATRHKQSFEGDIEAFLRDNAQGLPSYIRYMNSWARGLRRAQHCIVHYEDMKHDASSSMKRVLRFLDLDVADDALEAAVASSSFSNMRRIEEEKGIPGQAYDRSDPGAMRMREGRVGGYRQHLSEEQVALIERMCSSALSIDAKAILSRYNLTATEDYASAEGSRLRFGGGRVHWRTPSVEGGVVRRGARGIFRQLLAEAMIVLGLAAAIVAPIIFVVELGEWLFRRELNGYNLEDGLALFGIDRAGPVESPAERRNDVLLALPLTFALFVTGVLMLFSGVRLGEWGIQRLTRAPKLAIPKTGQKTGKPVYDEASESSL